MLAVLIFFFLMIRRPPRSTLFPYTRSSDLQHHAAQSMGHRHQGFGRGDRARKHRRWQQGVRHTVPGRRQEQPRAGQLRSEEHTSELQSQSNLVCRLLLEKKKETDEYAKTL